VDSDVGSGVEVVDSDVGSGVEVARPVGAGTGVITIVGLVVELEDDLLRTVEVVVVGAAVTVSVFFEEDGEGGAELGVSVAGEEEAALLVVGSGGGPCDSAL